MLILFFFRNAAYSTLCTVSRVSVPEIFSSAVIAETGPIVEGVMREVIQVARAVGINEELLPDHAVEDTIRMTAAEYGDDPKRKTKPNPYRPSMLVDLDFNRPMEVESIVGGVISRARQLNVPVPRLDVIYASLKVIQNSILVSRGSDSK